MIKSATIKLGVFGNKSGVEIILPDGRNIAPDLKIQAVEIQAVRGEFTIAKLTCLVAVEANLYFQAIKLRQQDYSRVVRQGIAALTE
jgi:hypothetical protein